MKTFGRLCLVALVLGCGMLPAFSQRKKGNKVPDARSLAGEIRRFAPTEVTADPSHLSAADRKALDKIIEAAKLMDGLFLRQVWSGNEALRKKLLADTTPLGRERLHYFRINAGPWSRIDGNAPFIPGVPEKPAGADF